MNAIDFLIKEHERVRTALADINNQSHHYETKKHLFNSLCNDLIRHETMEHQVWYPTFKNDSRLTDTVKHLLTEEKSAEKTIKQFDNIATQEAWEAKFIKFKKDVEHHASEEEKDLFPQVKKILSAEELEKIGKKMFEFKQNYTQH